MKRLFFVSQNFPQLVLQISYLWTVGVADEIAIISIIFSIISIIIAVTSIITQKVLLNAKGYAVVEFDITGSSVSSNSDKCRNKTSYIRDKISNELGLKKHLVEVNRPKKIPNGLGMTVNIHLDSILNRDIDYKKILNRLRDTGKLAENLKNFWDLHHAPKVSEITFRVEESRNRMKSAVTIKIENKTAANLNLQNVLSSSTKPNDTNALNEGKCEIVEPDAAQIELEAMPKVNFTTDGGENSDTDLSLFTFKI